MWTERHISWVILRGFISPVLLLDLMWWAVSSAIEGGPAWACAVVAVAGVIVLWDLFRERFDTGRQGMEIERLRERLEAAECHAVLDAEEE